ncbi:MAG: ATP phosphoribosyltransferase [archaeon]|nr:ATP phosphoribosyltransferase [archaeon]
MNLEKKLKVALPKGSLWKTVKALFVEAGYNITESERGYRPTINDKEIEIKLLRPQEIPNYLLYDDQFDLGISGKDWVKETGADVETVLDLGSGTVKIVFCIPNFWENINSLNDFIELFHKENKVIRISTEYINLSIESIMKCEAYKKYYGEKQPLVITPWKTWGSNEKIKLFLSFGATEAKPPKIIDEQGECDAIIDNTDTGSTLRANNLRIVEILDTSNGLLLANKKSLKVEWKKEKIQDITMLLKGVREARKKIHVFMNVREENLDAIIAVLPALKQPTVSKLAGTNSDGWLAINTIINKSELLDLMPNLRKLAQGIVVHEPRQVIET